MHKIFTRILSVLRRYISGAWELGIFESQLCLGCLPQKAPGMFDLNDFGTLCQSLRMLTGQWFFQILTTGLVESMLLDMVWDLSTTRYVCICI